MMNIFGCFRDCVKKRSKNSSRENIVMSSVPQETNGQQNEKQQPLSRESSVSYLSLPGTSSRLESDEKDIAGVLRDMCLLIDLQSENRQYTYSCDRTSEWSPRSMSIMALIGKQRFGTVYAAQHSLTKSWVFVKYEKSRAVRHYALECKIWASVSEHPYIRRYIGNFSDTSRFFILSEYSYGGNLGAMIRLYQTLSLKVVTIFTAQLFSVTHFLHQKKVFHRDITSSNIMVTGQGKILLTDFALATNQRFSLGIRSTWNYTAPEAFTGDRYNCLADWYSVGVCLYEMLMGQTPLECYCSYHRIDFSTLDFTGRLVVALTLKVYVLSRIQNPTMLMLRSLLEKNPEKRFGGAEDMTQFLEHPFFIGIDGNKLAEGELEAPLQEENYDIKEIVDYARNSTARKLTK